MNTSENELTNTVMEQLEDAGYKWEATGEEWGINATQYQVTKPDGSTELVWSPVWGNFYEPERGMLAALAVAPNIVKKD